MIRILIAEDQSLVRGALRALLELEPDFEVVAEADDGEEALRAVERYAPDLCLLDIEMPKLTGLDVAARLHDGGYSSRSVIVTTFARPGYLTRALEVGVRGYLLKTTPSGELAVALRRIAAGERIIDPELALDALTSPNPLSDRERDVLRLAAANLSTRQIADRLYLAEGTVRNYLSNAISKLGCEQRAEAVEIAQSKGWL
jgi:two-component system response regulator DesR